ncbi:exodeoxyribonuclease III [Nocardioidaceae bacterium SCSIO 66511]|nr:exodeoxyribonuclease III [Nocardioidaceae bacterium SCSIO 66511]
MRIATWNVNSIRARIDRVTDWLARSDVDVVALQETKCRDDQFPADRFNELGYSVAHHGLSQWNGVALCSRVGLDDVTIGFNGQPGWGDRPAAEARAIGATCAGVRVWSLYVPNGRALDDPHLQYKLDWLAALRTTTAEWLADDADLPLALMGDWNIAPHDDDVWEMAAYEGHTHVSDAERDAFQAVLGAGLTDVVRPYAPGPGIFTYWDYTRLSFQKRRGMRIDFILGSAAFENRVVDAAIDREERKGKGASDHAPVIVDLD